MDKLKAGAMSFAESRPPDGCREVYRERFGKNGSDTLIIYQQEGTGDVYYSTEHGLLFAKQMEQKKNKKEDPELN